MEKQKVLNTRTEGLVEDVLTREEQARLTPARVLELLKEGNERFVNGEVTLRNHKEQVRRAAANQFPKAIVLSCVDSRVPVEDVFDRGIGDVFVARVAGNFVNTDILGSMEFACKVSGAKLILVLGHEHCGAVRGAIDAVELGNITAMLENIKPAVESFAGYHGDKTSANEEFVHLVAQKNVQLNIDRIRQQSRILQEMEAAGEIDIVGAMYDMSTGQVSFLKE
jgi:carbonic anhydrase